MAGSATKNGIKQKFLMDHTGFQTPVAKKRKTSVDRPKTQISFTQT